MKTLIKMMKDESGASAAEYALILAIVGTGIAIAAILLGSAIGDHAKTAIGTRIMTGAITGTGVMHAAVSPVSSTVPAFSWVTDAGTKPYRLGKFVEVAMAVMQRRGVTQSQAYARRLTVLHETVTGQEAFSWPGKDTSHLASKAAT